MINVSARLNAAYTSGYSADKREGVAAHEVGHTLGLAHSSTCVLMNPTTPDRTNCGVFTPQQDDVDGVQAIYGSNGVGADSQKPAVMHLSQAQSFKGPEELAPRCRRRRVGQHRLEEFLSERLNPFHRSRAQRQDLAQRWQHHRNGHG